jgi:hypothetical protein
MEAWFALFMGESITAYENRHNPLSCVKGVMERLLTGLRAVGDEELNALFLQVEGPHLIGSMFAGMTIKGMAAVLRERGMTPENTSEEAALVLETFLMQQIVSYDQKVETCQGAILNTVEALTEAYEASIKPLLTLRSRVTVDRSSKWSFGMCAIS